MTNTSGGDIGAPDGAAHCCVAKSPASKDEISPPNGQNDRRIRFSGVDALLNYKQEDEGTDEPISVSKETTSYKTKGRDKFQISKDFHTRRKDIKAKVGFQRNKAILPRLKSPEYRALMEQHGIHMAETLFYDVYPERGPEEMLTKFVTTADKIESACPQQLELPEEPTVTKGGSDEPAIEEGEVPLDDEGRRIYHRNVLAATRNLRCIADTGSALHARSLDDIPIRERQMIIEALRPMTLQTANGETLVNKQIATRISKLGCAKDMYVLEDSPSIISVGRLVLDDGCDFYWRHKDRKAVLVRPEGRRIVLENGNHTPMLTI